MRSKGYISLLAIALLFSACGGGSSDNGGDPVGEVPPVVGITEFTGAVEISLSNERNDSINIEDNNLIDYFKLEVTSLGIYTLYTSSYAAGTDADYAYRLQTDIHGPDELMIKRSTLNFELTSIGEEWQTTEFEVTEIGTHYFKTYRERVGPAENKTTNYKFQIEPSLKNNLVQDEEGEFNDVQSQATQHTVGSFIHDINGTVNVVRDSDAADWYELQNLIPGTYTLYLEAKSGTEYISSGQSLRAKVYDIYGNLHTDLSAAYAVGNMDQAGEWYRETFEVLSNESYFIKISRDYDLSTAYSFKVLPSIANGYELDANGEPNDVQVLAKSIVLDDINTTIEDSINMTDITDADDWFEFTSDVTQTVDIRLETLSGTTGGTYTLLLEIVDVYGNTLKQIPTNQFLLNYENEYVVDSFNLVMGSKYYLHVNRRYNPLTTYKITISK
ncbi:MAG: hypothetical protein COB67_05875 [SAR324 cluster bacterium]|uniref:GOLD domain-containing protein n=1 Tax=SAR324 cluster bacterium TaxID=2024889 RepID=A0A2A4T5S6_9DELT|nr:MAG: hypothetical protein COB67_05875 [SAR324 cluster bacterium]